jgi:sec-independent protein translocase protein TatA
MRPGGDGAMGGLGFGELLVILLIVVVLFGAKKIPEIMGGLGKGIKSFKKAMDTDDEPAPPALAPNAPVTENAAIQKTEAK